MKIPERQEQLDALTRKYLTEPKAEDNGHRTSTPTPDISDEEIVALCRKAKNAAKFSDLFDAGDTTPYGGDESSADLALVSMCAFYTQDPAQLERLFRQSALYRRKWDEKRGARTYGQRTIDKALEGARETYSKPRVEVHYRSRSLGNLGMSNDPEQSVRAVSFRGREKPGPREWIVERAICKGHAATWYGESGIAKSLLATHQGLSLAAPNVGTWADLKIATVPVLFGDFELDETEHLRRSQELAAGMGLDDVPEEFHYLPLAGLPAEEAFGIAAEECGRIGAGLFIVDSVGFALEGDGELSKDVLRFHKDCLRPIKEAGATPHLIDHQAKVIKGEKYSDKQEFGSVYKTNSVRSSFQIRGAWDGNELTATFTHRKTNFGPKVPAFSLKLLFGGGRVKVERLEEAVPNPDRGPSKKEQVFEAVEELGRATAETAARKTGISLQTVRNAVSELVSEGALKDTGEKQGRSRIVVTHSQTTKGTGTGTKAQADTSRYQEAF